MWTCGGGGFGWLWKKFWQKCQETNKSRKSLCSMSSFSYQSAWAIWDAAFLLAEEVFRAYYNPFREHHLLILFCMTCHPFFCVCLCAETEINPHFSPLPFSWSEKTRKRDGKQTTFNTLLCCAPQLVHSPPDHGAHILLFFKKMNHQRVYYSHACLPIMRCALLLLSYALPLAVAVGGS
jgi:hypothetical protein